MDLSIELMLSTPAGLARLLSDGRWRPARHLDALSLKLIDLAARKTRRLIVSMPPRHGKSELVSHWFPVWYLDTFPDHEVMFSAYGADFAAEWGMKVRDSIAQGKGILGVELGKKQRENRFFTTEGGVMGTSGVCGEMTGKGAHLLIIDDPIKNNEEADSKVYRDKVWNWWQSTALTRLAPNGVVVLVMTRWHEDDLAGRLLAQSRQGEGERWEELRFPALAEDEDPLGRQFEQPLWPERFDAAYWADRKAVTHPRWWNALYQQRPSAEEGEIFQRSWWRRYSKAPQRFDSLIQSWDCAFKDLKGSDFVVGQVWGRFGPDRYLLHQVRERMAFTATINAVRATSTQYPQAAAKLVEDKANGTAVMDVLRKELSGLISVEPQGGKVARAWAVQPFLQAGNVWVPQAQWADDLIEECANFPNGAHDDQVDAMTQALTYLSHGGGSFKQVQEMQAALPRSFVDRSTIRAFS